MGNSIDIAKLIHNGGVFKDVEGSTPQEIYEKVSKLINLPFDVTADQVFKGLCERENVMSTAVGNGIALPHSRIPIFKDEKEQRICVVYLKTPLDMGAPDEKPVSVMFVLLTLGQQVHLQVLTALANLLKDSRFKKALEIKASEEKLAAIIRDLN